MLSNALRMKFIVLAAASTLALVACSDDDAKTAMTTTAPPAQSSTTTDRSVTQTGYEPGSQGDLEANAGSRIYFGYDEYNLDDRAQDTLSKQAQWLKRYPNKSFTVEGHADERGTREYNLALGARRAESVRNYLIGRGVSAGRIDTISFGKERPIAAGASEDSWARNRNGHTAIVSGAQ